jgi:hypothetical protein
MSVPDPEFTKEAEITAPLARRRGRPPGRPASHEGEGLDEGPDTIPIHSEPTFDEPETFDHPLLPGYRFTSKVAVIRLEDVRDRFKVENAVIEAARTGVTTVITEEQYDPLAAYDPAFRGRRKLRCPVAIIGAASLVIVPSETPLKTGA